MCTPIKRVSFSEAHVFYVLHNSATPRNAHLFGYFSAVHFKLAKKDEISICSICIFVYGTLVWTNRTKHLLLRPLFLLPCIASDK
mmetsp:Transcript_14719/g.21608  ORF Transcript_14719/g.21608 Transcript_14719/m.21608 type:complete len:85 (+) Transcript_14719:65-319(+)